MRRLIRALSSVVALVGVQGQFVQADVKLPAVIGNHMVLQRDQLVPVWGWAAPGEEVTVRFADTTSKTQADETGHWRVTLPSLAADSQPRSIYIEGSSGSQIELTDILVGEVWFCTGPSNIYWPVQKCDNAEQEIRRADFPEIRFFTVEKRMADEPQDDCVGNWFGCSPETVGDVSGIGYFFSRRIHQDVNVPVGLLQSYWGGSRVEAWTSRGTLEAEPALKPILDWWDEEFRRSADAPAVPQDPHRSQHRPACLYNGMIAPLIPFSIRGVLCYQGLGNLFWADYSAVLLETWVRDCRTRWGQGDMPIGMVQPAPFNCADWPRSGPDAYSIQREAQLLVQKDLEHTGIALTMDVDAVEIVHFTNKQLVGRRLASWALTDVYGFDLPYAGPLYESQHFEGESIRVQFQHADSGLTTSDGRPPRHFEIAGDDHEYHPAEGRIDGSAVVVHSDQVTKPVSVRFAFTDTAVVNLINQEGLPASLFRTDKAAARSIEAQENASSGNH